MKAFNVSAVLLFFCLNIFDPFSFFFFFSFFFNWCPCWWETFSHSCLSGLNDQQKRYCICLWSEKGKKSISCSYTYSFTWHFKDFIIFCILVHASLLFVSYKATKATESHKYSIQINFNPEGNWTFSLIFLSVWCRSGRLNKSDYESIRDTCRTLKYSIYISKKNSFKFEH